MFRRSRPFTLFMTELIHRLVPLINLVNRRRRRFFALITLLTCLSLIAVLSVNRGIPCAYLDPCNNETIISFLGETTLSEEICPVCKQPQRFLPAVNVTVTSLDQLERQITWSETGGRHKPKHCVPRQKVAIIIPYRNREDHLLVFLKHIHPFLRNQSIYYGIYVVEQSERGLFNRGSLLNIGFEIALRYESYDCFIFHDVDYIPLHINNVYGCSAVPKHMSPIVDTYNDKLLYPDFFGGVVALTIEQFRRINGFPNRYWGWGGEDDDVVERFRKTGYSIARHLPHIARYVMLKHSRDRGNPINPKRHQLLYKAQDEYQWDGLNRLNYTLRTIQLRKLYTWIYVDLFEPQPSRKHRHVSGLLDLDIW